MGAKYCKNERCTESKKGVCVTADSCAFFLWDIDREKGDKQPIGNPLESEEQKEFASWCNAKGLLWVHIPNERKATVAVMSELAKQGVMKGFPDNFIAEPRGKYHGLFIELKRTKNSTSRKGKEQREWIKALNEKGYKAEFAFGAEEAKRIVLEYLQGEEK